MRFSTTLLQWQRLRVFCKACGGSGWNGLRIVADHGIQVLRDESAKAFATARTGSISHWGLCICCDGQNDEQGSQSN